MPSVGADGVWGAAPGVGVGSCLMASRVGRGAASARAASSRTATWAAQTVVGEGCLLHDVDLPHGARPAGHLFALRAARRRRRRRRGPGLAEEVRGRVSDPANDLSGGAACWTCVALSVEDEVKKPGKSTLCGVPVEAAAVRLGLDPAEGGVVWAEGEARTTTLARVFPVAATAAEGASAALDLVHRHAVRRGTARQATARAGERKRKARRRALVGAISEALRARWPAHGPAVRRREALRGRVIGHAVGMLLAKDTPVEQWRARAPPGRACRVREARAVCARANPGRAPAGTKARGGGRARRAGARVFGRRDE